MKPSVIVRKPQAAAFTLIEMLVTVAIVCLLIALLAPALQNAEERTWRVQCMHNVRQLMNATILYVGDYSGYLPHPTWGCQDSLYKPGWAYNGSAASGLSGGAIWPYLRSAKVYRCPADMGPWRCDASLNSSYVMNGAVCGYPNSATCPPNPPPVVHSYKLVMFKGNDILFWEADEDSGNPSSCVIGSDICNGGDLGQYPYEGISQRHKTGANMGNADGSVDWLLISDYYAMGAKSPCVTWRTRLWCNPGTADGH